MKVKNLLIALLLGLCLTSMLASCCVSKAFEEDNEPYLDDLNLPPAE